MRKVVAGLAISLDGVVEAPSQRNWMLYNDEMGELIGAGIAQADAILLGRRTYLEFAELWPKLGSDVPMADFMNNTPKYIVSSTLHTLEWANSILVTGDLAERSPQAQGAARQEHPDPGQPQAGAVAPARRAARRARPHGPPDRARFRHAPVRRDDRANQPQTRGLQDPQHRRGTRDVPAGPHLASTRVWWDAGAAPTVGMMRPWLIGVDRAALNDLRDRLRRTRWPERETVGDWSQGVPLGYLQDLCGYWAGRYDWPATAARLNQIPQFMTRIDGLDIHFLHVRSPHPGAVPLLMTHGWPGSFLEFERTLGLLSDPSGHGGDAPGAFHVVVPSLPGYGFSGKPATTGWDVHRIARAWAGLMTGLGYERFLAEGSDWGSSVSTSLALQVPGRLLGIHLVPPLAPPDRAGDLTGRERAALAATSAPAPDRATPPSTAPARKPSATRCSIHRPGCAHGSLRSCGPGPTTRATSARSSPPTRCWTTSPCTG